MQRLEDSHIKAKSEFTKMIIDVKTQVKDLNSILVDIEKNKSQIVGSSMAKEPFNIILKEYREKVKNYNHQRNENSKKILEI